MMKKDLEHSMPEKQVQGTLVPAVSRPQELTCTEGQMEDLLAEGETTESEADNDDADNSSERAQMDAAERKSLASSKSGLKQ